MRWLPIFLLIGGMLNLATQPLIAQTLEKSSPARLRHLVQQDRADTNQVRALLLLSTFQLRKEAADRMPNLDSALLLATQAEKLSRRLRFSRGLDDALFVRGQVYIRRQATGRVVSMLQSLQDTTRIKMLVELGMAKAKPTAGQHAEPDSALYFLHQAERLSARLGLPHWHEESLFQLGVCHILYRDELPRGKAYFKQVIVANQRARNQPGEMKAWNLLGQCLLEKAYDQPQHYPEILACFQSALTLARQLRNRSYETAVLLSIAKIHQSQGNLRQAEQEMVQAAALQRATGNQRLYYTYQSLAVISQGKGDLNKELYYILQSIKALEALQNPTKPASSYAMLGSVYLSLGQIDKSVEAFKKSLAISHQQGKVMVDGVMTRKMARALIKQGNAAEALSLLQGILRSKTVLAPIENLALTQSLGECYAALKQNQRAEHYYKMSVRLGQQLGPTEANMAYWGIGQFYATTGQYTKAAPFLQRLEAVPTGRVPPIILQEAHLLSFKIDSAAGRYLAAITHFQQHKALKDAIYSATKSRELEELQVAYETSKKEQHILLLTEKARRQTAQVQRQRSALRQVQTARNATIAGALLLLLLLGLGYNRYRLKQRTNQQLQAQQREINEKNHSLEVVLREKEWLLKEIHHRVKNNLQIIISLLQSQSKYLLDEAAINAIEQSQHRVRAMALIHQKLYRSESLSRIDMPAYIKEVVEQLSECFDPEEQIHFRFQLAPLELDVAQAVPLGLIINEAITNALKYAFPPHSRPTGHGGTVELTLAEVDAEHYLLVVADDGVGMPADVDLRRSNSMGANIMRGLSKQLGGELQVDSGHGVTISVPFTLFHLQPRYAEAS